MILEIKREYLSLKDKEGSINLENPYGSVGVSDTIVPTAEFSGALDNVEVNYDLGVHLDGSGSVDNWDRDALASRLGEIETEKREKIKIYERKKRTLVRSFDFVGKTHPRMSAERKFELYKKNFDDLTDQDFEVLFDTMPQALYGWLENIETLLATRTHVEGAAGLSERVNTALKDMRLLKSFKQYKGPVDNEIAAKVYSE